MDLFFRLQSRPAIRLFGAIVLAAGMWMYVQHILIPRQIIEAVATDRPRGNLSDLYPRWLGARELLLRRHDPYSAEVTRQIQQGYYGRALEGRAGDPKDQQAFAYPVYVVFLLYPTIFVNFDVVRPIFTFLLVLLTVASVHFWIGAFNWEVGGVDKLALTLIVLGSFQVVQGLKLQQFSLVVGALIAAAVFFVTRGHLFTAGFLLAVSTIKPQLSAPVIVCLVIWVSGAWRTRLRFLVGLLATMVVLLSGATLILPGWLAKFLAAVQQYRVYAASGSILDALVGAFIGQILTGVLIVVCVWLAFRLRHSPADSEDFKLTTSLVLSTTVTVLPMVAPYNQVLLLPTLILMCRRWAAVKRSGLFTQVIGLGGVVLLAMPWLTAFWLVGVSFFVSPSRLRGWLLPAQSTIGWPIVITALLVYLAFRRVGRFPAKELHSPITAQ